MAEETPKANGAAPPAATKDNGGKKKQKDLKPIEELYDLSKPIPRVSEIARNDLDVPECA
jgi:hypothetical protein